MMPPSVVVKSTAKSALKKNYFKSCVAGILFLFVAIINVFVADLIAVIAGKAGYFISLAVLSCTITFPCLLGLIRCYWRMLYNGDYEVTDVFYYFFALELYIRGLMLVLKLTFKVIIIGFLLMIPAIIVDVFSGNWIYEVLNLPIPLFLANLSIASVFLKSIAGVVLFYIMLRYYLAPMLYVANEDINADEAMHLSTVISKGSSLEFVFLIFSFIIYILVSFLMIPLIFTLPFFAVSYLVHARFSVAQYNKIVDGLGIRESNPASLTI